MWWLRLLLAAALSVSCLLAQDIGCGSLTSQYAMTNLANLSADMANIQEFRNLALQPLLSQTRVPGTPGNAQARAHIKTWMQSVGWTVTEDSFTDNTPYGPIHFTNVVATLNPAKTNRVVFACHYDSKLMNNVRFVGAIDSAVPCAVMMDVALRLKNFFMSKQASTADLTVQFIFFDGEEAFYYWTDQDSLYGARHLAKKWAAQYDSRGQNYLQGIETFVLLDLIGTADTHFKMRFQETHSVYNKMRSIESCLRQHGLLLTNQYQIPLFTAYNDFTMIDDDHIPFYQKGVPIVHLITSPFPQVWHSGSDDINALDFSRIDNLSRILRLFLADLHL